MTENAVIVVYCTITVLVYITTFDRLTVLVIHLLVKVESIGGIAYLMRLNIITRTAGYTTGSDIKNSDLQCY